jgi:hypothetical protein
MVFESLDRAFERTGAAEPVVRGSVGTVETDGNASEPGADDLGGHRFIDHPTVGRQRRWQTDFLGIFRQFENIRPHERFTAQRGFARTYEPDVLKGGKSRAGSSQMRHDSGRLPGPTDRFAPSRGLLRPSKSLGTAVAKQTVNPGIGYRKCRPALTTRSSYASDCRYSEVRWMQHLQK